jgi:hypothetical protein
MHDVEDAGIEPETRSEAVNDAVNAGEPIGEGGLEREARGWCGGRGFDESGYGYGAYAASDDIY